MKKPSVSYWVAKKPLQTTEPLKQNLETEICVVGAGIAGLTCAYLLALDGKKVAVLESGKIANGETGRTTAHLTNVLDDRYYELEKLFGEKTAKLAAESHAQAIDFIEKIVQENQIDCRFERVNAYLFAPNQDDVPILEKELEACNRAGLDVEFIEKAPIATFDTGSCLKFTHQAQFSPLDYIARLFQLAKDLGVEFFTDTHVSEFNKGSVKTSKGFQVSYNDLIVTTDTPINDRFLIHTKQAAYRTYVIGAKVPPGSLEKALYYDTLDPYHYIRLDEDILIVGGEDHRTGQDDYPDARYDQLEAWIRKRIPEMGPIEYKWSGQIMEPVDSLAFIGKNPLDSHVYVATGDSGNGITHGTIAGLLIRDLILERKNSWEEVYAPSRKTLAAAKDYIEENTNTFKQYLDWLHSAENQTLNPGEGAIIKKNGKKIAAYCDEHGKMHECSPVCPHLDGQVRWNSAEKTWDCPCHGSRFSCFGKVINGPAISDLKKEN